MKMRTKGKIACPYCGKPIPLSIAGSALGTIGGREGGFARARKLSKKRRQEIARKAGLASGRARKEKEDKQ